MDVYPAIDIKDGKCVRLNQGDFSRVTVFGDSPLQAARHWEEQGASWLHVVDLDGARAGHLVNDGLVKELTQAIACRVQFGGGLRCADDLELAFAAGIERAVLGTAAVRDPELVKAACRAYPGRIAVGIDSRNGLVATHGWAEITEMAAVDLAKRMAGAGVAAVIYTDIERDGMLGGANVAASAEIARAVDVPVIAGGGVTTLDDIRRLAAAGLSGAIVGLALYTADINLPEALAAAAGSRV